MANTFMYWYTEAESLQNKYLFAAQKENMDMAQEILKSWEYSCSQMKCLATTSFQATLGVNVCPGGETKSALMSHAESLKSAGR